jgi:uncharacterized protein YcbK (DUF882 family)
LYDTNAAGKSTAGKLWRAARTACLLAGTSCAAIMLVDLPTAFAAQSHEQPIATIQSAEGLQQLQREQRRKANGIQLASLGREAGPFSQSRTGLAERSVRWNASSGCLNSTLRRVVSEVAANFGPVTVNSTCRSHGHNARVGGARQSLHLTGNAADFRIAGDTRRVLAFLNAHRSVGGLKHYGGGVFHIDTGPRRTW